MSMRSRLLLVALVLGLPVLVPGVASASCVPPSVSVDKSSVAPGEVITVTGDAWMRGCSDTGGPRAPPRQGLAITFDQGGTHLPLTTVDADRDYRFTVDVTIPETARTGAAKITAATRTGLDATAAVTVTASPDDDEDSLPRTGIAVGAATLVAVLAISVGVLLHRRAKSAR
jgi:hypothetical protein